MMHARTIPSDHDVVQWQANQKFAEFKGHRYVLDPLDELLDMVPDVPSTMTLELGRACKSMLLGIYQGTNPKHAERQVRPAVHPGLEMLGASQTCLAPSMPPPPSPSFYAILFLSQHPFCSLPFHPPLELAQPPCRAQNSNFLQVNMRDVHGSHRLSEQGHCLQPASSSYTCHMLNLC